MQWWNSLVRWVQSDDGWRIVSDAVVPFVAIVVAGVVAALIGRAALRRVVRLHDDEARASAVAGIITAARKSATYSSLGAEERAFSDHLAQEAEVRLRLLPIPGSGVAASWAEHELAEIKRNSASFSFQSEQSLAEFRDRLLEWQSRPSRAKKLFKQDLERWKYEEAESDKAFDERQRAWKAERDTTPASGSATSPSAGRRPDAATPPDLVPVSPVPRSQPSPAQAPAPTPPSDDYTAFRPTPAPVFPRAAPSRAERDEAAPTAAPAVRSSDDRPEQASAPTAALRVDRDASDDGDDDGDRLGTPVSAHQVRRRTSPDPADD